MKPIRYVFMYFLCINKNPNFVAIVKVIQDFLRSVSLNPEVGKLPKFLIMHLISTVYFK